MKSETKPVALHFRVTQQVREAVDRAAMEDGRTVSQYANRVLEEHLRERGYLTRQNGEGPATASRGASKERKRKREG